MPSELLAWNVGTQERYRFLELGKEMSDSYRSLWPVSARDTSKAAFDVFSVPMPQAGSSKLVFTSNRDGNAEIYSMDTDGGNLVRLTSNSTNDDNPRWSPNGTKILFQSDRDTPDTGNYDIYVMNADGTGQTRLTYDAADDSAPVWSADGSKIAFQSLRNNLYYQVYVMNADGTNQVNITSGTSADTQPSWSPDGTKIAFSSERDQAGRPSIYVMNANGTNQIRVTFSSDPFRDEQPVWSRDGSKIAFVSTRDSIIETWQETDDEGGVLNRSRVRTNKEIYLMNADGSNQLRLTNTLENDDAAYWSPDNTKIIFRSERERDCCDPAPQLWTMNADGTNQTLVAGNTYGDYSPSWAAIGNQPPVANPGGPYTAMTAQAVQFSGSGSFDPDGSITSYAWNFGDNTSGSGVSPTHVFASVGTYTVTLTATDNSGAQVNASTTATINPRTMENFSASFSQWSLLRQTYPDESTYWNDIFRAAQLNQAGSLTIATREFGRTLFESSEYAARNRSDHEYVYDLYKAYLMREPDAPSWDAWTALVPIYGREEVRRGFDESVEFLNLVATMSTSGSPSSAVSSFATARKDPFNQPGNGLVSRDAEWSVALLSLPGRAGLDLGLSLSYSSMVWTRSGPYLYFDEDAGWPSPGFTLGFPTIQEKSFDAQVGDNVYLLTTPSGQRVELRQLGTSSTYEAADSSYLQLIDYGSSLLVRSTDGTQLSYLWFNHEWRCNQIKDRNGNYLTVNYDWLGHITTITDTLARTITFNYDTNANLISITQSWTVNGVPQTHTWATFGWSTLSIQASFSGAMAVGAPNGSTIPVLNQVGLDDGSRYNFEYTGAGQVSFIRRFTSDNVQRAYTAYDYQTTGGDCPRVSATHLWAENWTGINGLPAEVTTQYSDPEDGSHLLTAPDGTVYKEFYGGTGVSPVWQKGLPIQTEIWSTGERQKWTTLTWTQDNTGVSYQTNPRVTESNIYDSSGNRRRVTLNYNAFTLPSGSTCNLQSDTREYAADAVTILRRSHTDYRMDPLADASYLSRHLLGLVKEQSLYEVNGGIETLMSKVGVQYDETGSIQGTDAPVQHDNSNYTSSFVTGRANLSSVKRYDVNDTSQFSVSSLRYNTAGAMVATIDPLAHQTSVSYAESFSDSNNSRNTLAYPTTVTDADANSSFIQYDFDFGGKTRTQGPPPAGQPQGVIQTLTYDGAARVDRVTTTNNGAFTRYVYGPNYVQSFATVNTLADEAYAIQVFDGAGRVTATASNHPGSAGGYSAQDTIYDQMGRTVKQSNPTEIAGSWLPAGDDAAGWLYTQQTYNWQGKPLVTTNTDTTTKELSYSGCGCAGGEVVTLTDEGTIVSGVAKKRQQKIYSDVLGRNIKSEVLNWDGGGPFGTGGSVYSTITNSYNARDQVKLVRQYEGTDSNGVYQDTVMTYDGYGRLKTKHVPQQDANATTTYDYNSDDTVQKVTDARGAFATYTYNARHLVTGITYEPSAGVTDTPDASFGYDDAGNRIGMTDGLGSASYDYDQLSRMTSETRSFTGVGSYNLNYGYNLAGQLNSVTDPFNANIAYSYDQTGRLSGVTGAGFGNVTEYASGMQYRAWGSLKRLTFGNSSAPQLTSLTYSSRMVVQRMEIRYANTNVLQQSEQYQYHNDGRVRLSLRPTNPQQDRSYTYDHLGTFVQALTSEEARGETVTIPTEIPFAQNYGHDVWGNLTSRSGKYWGQNTASLSATYSNHRNTAWTYDAEGNLLQEGTRQYTYDVAGRNLSVTEPPRRPNQPGLSQAQTFDGDGRRAKRVENGTTVYELHAAGLGGAMTTELNAQGNKRAGYVYANGSLLAVQAPESGRVSWVQRSPGGTGEWVSHSDAVGTVRSLELDPLLNDVGIENPNVTGGVGGDGGSYPNYGDPIGPQTCALNDDVLPCDYVMKVMAREHAISLFFLIRARIGFSRTRSTETVYDGESILIDEDHTTTFGENGEFSGPSVTVGPTAEVLQSIESVRITTQWSVSRLPQNTGQVFPPIDLDKLKGLIQDRLNHGDCAKYVASLINKAAELSKGKNPAVGTDIMALFDKIRSQPNGGIVFAPPHPGVAGGGGTTEGYYRNGSMKIRITPLGYFKDNPRGAYSIFDRYGLNGLHEVIHGAGQNEKYLEPNLLRAANQLEPNAGYYDWNQALIKHCLPPYQR